MAFPSHPRTVDVLDLMSIVRHSEDYFDPNMLRDSVFTKEQCAKWNEYVNQAFITFTKEMPYEEFHRLRNRALDVYTT